VPSARSSRMLREVALPVTAAGSLVGLLAATWAGLWQQAPTGDLALLAAMGMVPALVRVCGIPHAGLWAAVSAVPTAAVALAASVQSNPVRLFGGDADTWSALGDIIPNGLGNAAATPLPLAPDRAPPLASLLLLVLAAAACLIAWQIVVARRPLAGVIAAATGLAYRWTLVPPARPVLIGVVTLVIALVAFRLASPARSTRALSGRSLVAGSMIVALALVGSVGADGAPASWWNWREWTFGTGRPPTSLSLKQSYGPLEYPDKPVVIARVESDEAVPLRAVTLEDFDGSSFVPAASEVSRTSTSKQLEFSADQRGNPRRVTQKITMGNTRSPWLLAGGRPSSIAGLGRREVTLFDDSSVRLKPALESGTKYTVEALVPDPGQTALVNAGLSTDVDPRLLAITVGGGEPAIEVPAWGPSGPAALDPQQFGQYGKVYELSRTIIGKTTNPYVAVNRVENYLRRRNVYNESVPRSVGTPELANFLLTTKRGYCQHFAGSMALMLRMNGIPARVAVGFTFESGRFDTEKQSQEIIDRDAHSWVEVQFPGYGWIPFDPTPGRSVPNVASTSSADYSRTEIDLGPDSDVATAPVAPAPQRNPQINEPNFETSQPATARGFRWWAWLAAGMAVLGLLAPVGVKVVRRLRRGRGDERTRVLGAAREFESWLVDLGHPADPAATPAERVHASWRALGIDAKQIYGLASAARFDPTEPPRGSGDAAWRALRTARRSVGWRRRARAFLRLRSLRA
jgi:transglutaminase-like putative cysteine protease